ncbi:MAG: OpgC domain-containing protein [Pseudomonadota bacterium]
MNKPANISSLPPHPEGKRIRDPRLDFFRGIAMFIIFMAHMPGNFFTLYIPARFGWSDATEIFVFCSGMASAIAFGAIFRKQSWWMGTMRILHRIWQVYWAHIGLFFTILLLVVFQTWISRSGTLCFYEGSRLCEDWNYVGRLNIIHLFQETGNSSAMENFAGLMTLTWVPNLFDILPMYIGILFMVPVVVALYMFKPVAALGFIIASWLLAQEWIWTGLGFPGIHLTLPAEPWSERTWFFNPFAWQLVFFTGFAFMSGWLPKPPIKRVLTIVCLTFLIITIPFAFWGIHNDEAFQPSIYGPEIDFSWLPIKEFREEFQFLRGKSDFGLFRYLHFLALAYIFWRLAGENGRNLNFQGRFGQWFVKIVHKVGQQSLATFMGGLVLARFCGFTMDVIGRNQGAVIFGENSDLAWWFNWIPMTLVNLLGMAGMVAIAFLVGWIKKTPWKPKRDAVSASPAEPVRATGI